MKKVVRLIGATCGVVLLAACAESPTEPQPPKPEPEWVYEGQWGTYGDGNGEFQLLSGVAVGPNGNVYAVEDLNCRVQYFTATGSFLGKWGSGGFEPCQFLLPEAVAAASSGNVYVADTQNDRIKYYTSDGTFLDTGIDIYVREKSDGSRDRPMSVFAAELDAGTYVFNSMDSDKNFYTIGAIELP